MHPVLFSVGSFTLYTYGFCIAFGAVCSFVYLYFQSKWQYQKTFDETNTLFLIIIVSSVVGGKLFMIFESPSYYLENPKAFFSRSGFVFFGALLTAIPAMLIYFKKTNSNARGMLDIIAGVACIVHGIGRLGCLAAGCCYGTLASGSFAITFTNTACVAPLNTPLHPVQLYESVYIGVLFIGLLLVQQHKKFDGQIFILYLILYSIGRSVLELYRGDEERGFVFGQVSNSQFISALVVLVSIYFYVTYYRARVLKR